MELPNLTFIFFSNNYDGSIRDKIPADAILTNLSNNNQNKITFYIVDEKISNNFKNSDNIIYYPRSIHQWDDIFDKNKNKENTDIRHPIESISGKVIVLCFSNIECDTYSIMEEFPTQRYQDCLYYQWDLNDNENQIEKYIKEWSNQNTISSPRPQSKQIKSHYELYSGDKIHNENNLNKNSIYLHMILLCDYIRAYLRFGLLKEYDVSKMRQFSDVEIGYKESPFFTDSQQIDMVKNSFYFQAEDPILKGFLLYHKICVADGKISPLNVEITIQNLIFNHGQFRRELIKSMMKVVANFSVNNGFLSEKDFNIEKEEEEEEIKQKVKETKEVKEKKKTSSVTTTKIKKQDSTLDKVKKPKNTQPNKEYFTDDLWKLISIRINKNLE